MKLRYISNEIHLFGLHCLKDLRFLLRIKTLELFSFYLLNKQKIRKSNHDVVNAIKLKTFIFNFKSKISFLNLSRLYFVRNK
jgi:hypothetical protein